MKYVVILADGMADHELEELGYQTPLAYANTPCLERLAPYSEIGTVDTIPKGCPKGSDTANLSILGYNPQKYAFGRSPLEALSMGVSLKATDVTFRVNLVTLSDEMCYDEKRILDYSGGEITTEEAHSLLQTIEQELGDENLKFYAGVSYRHLLVWNHGSNQVKLKPPHDILEQIVGEYRPQGDYEEKLWELMKKSYDILNHHPINEKRKAKGLKPANSIWIWGQGIKPHFPNFKMQHGIEGAVISAVDLIKGIGIGIGMKALEVPRSTGTVYTNYQGKAEAAIDWLIHQDKDFVYIHLEGPDECGHQGDLKNKIKAMEYIDEKIIKPVLEALDKKGETYRLMILPDHATPVKLRSHTDEKVPFMIYDSRQIEKVDIKARYTEAYAKLRDNEINEGYTLIEKFLVK